MCNVVWNWSFGFGDIKFIFLAQSSSILSEKRKDNNVFQFLKWIFESFDVSKREYSESFDQEQQWMLFSDF